jgi:myo-inositol-1(or 4)-monophosphatase
MKPMLNFGQSAVRRASKLILQALDRLESISMNQAERKKMVEQLRVQSGAEMIDRLSQAYPGHSIYSPDRAVKKDNTYIWVVEPICGTSNFYHGNYTFVSSLTLHHRGRPEMAIIYDMLRDEMFSAYLGDGAYLNQRRIRVSPIEELENIICATDALPARNHLSLDPRQYRITGCPQLDLAYVAAGKIDAFISCQENTRGASGGCLIIMESGGRISRKEKPSVLIASGAKIHDKLIQEYTKQEKAAQSDEKPLS